jgi:hypothetical protein
MSKTVITSSKVGARKVAQPAKNQVYVNSRGGGPAEHIMTKQASIKHQNPEFFKRQSDRKNSDQSPFQAKTIARGTQY